MVDQRTYAGIVVLLIALPTGAAVTAVVALAILGRRLECELTELRRSLRLVGAAAVAADELRRSSTDVTDHAIVAADRARLLARRPRPVGRRHPR